MKSKKNNTILVGIDYTKSSENALNYAAILAKQSKSSLLLFHMYQTPVIHTYSGIYFVSFNELQKYNKEKLDKYKDKYKAMHPGVEMHTLATYKSFKDGVSSLIRKYKLHVVVLGLETKTKLSKFIYGTTGVDVAGKIKCPVIIVPEKYKNHKAENCILAIDNRAYLKADVLSRVKDFSKQFKIKNEYVHFKTEDDFLVAPSERVKDQNKKLNVKMIESKDFVSGLNNYAKKAGVDLTIVVSRSHSFMFNLFNETNTKKIAFGSQKPVMSIHE